MADVLIAACPQCQKKYKFTEEQLGKKARCKQCETVFTIGAEQAASAGRTPPPSAAPPAARPAPPRPAPPKRAAAPEVSINLQGEWTVLQGECNGLPAIVRVNDALKPIAGKAYHNQQITIIVYFDSAGPQGMPTDQDDLARVDATEDLLMKTLQTAGESLLALAVTNDGSRTLTFYSRDSQSAVARFQEIIPQLPSRNVEFFVEDDPGWELYRQFAG